MSAAITTTPAPTVRLCPLCHGTGSGLYNVLSDLSACEACGGTGEQPACLTKGDCTDDPHRSKPIKTSADLIRSLRGSAFRRATCDGRGWFVRRIATLGTLARGLNSQG